MSQLPDPERFNPGKSINVVSESNITNAGLSKKPNFQDLSLKIEAQNIVRGSKFVSVECQTDFPDTARPNNNISFRENNLNSPDLPSLLQGESILTFAGGDKNSKHKK
jgi:hypothetical protein